MADPREIRKGLLGSEEFPSKPSGLLTRRASTGQGTPARSTPQTRKERQDASFETILHGMTYRAGEAQKDRDTIRDINNLTPAGLQTVGPNEGYEFEGSHDTAAELRRRAYRATDPERGMIQADPAVAGDPAQDSGDPGSAFRSTVNFLFSDEMGMLGMKWDDEGFDWNKENFVNQFQEHPYSSAFTLASYIVPVGFAWQKGARVAERGAKLAGMAGAPEALAKGTGVLGTSAKLGFKFDEHAQLVQKLASSPINDSRQLFSKSVTEGLKKATSPEDVEKLVSKGDLRKMLMGDYHQERFYELRALAKAGNLTVKQRAAYETQRLFGNSYFSKLQDMNKANIESMDDFFVKAQLGKYLASAPTKLGDKGNKAIYNYWLEGASRNFKGLSDEIGEENAKWADSLQKEWTQLFQDQTAEGFLDASTVSMFGLGKGGLETGMHLPAIKKGTAGFEDIGGNIAAVAPGRMGELTQIRKLDPAKALTGPTTKHRGDLTTTEKVRERLDDIVTDPRQLTAGGFVKDNVLFQIHRSFRDVITDAVEAPAGKWGQMIATRTAYEAMPNYAKKNFIAFDKLDDVVPGLSDRMRRMVDAKVAKEGLDPAKYRDMPVVDAELLKTFFGDGHSAKQAAGNFKKFFELMTAVHKTSRTALNIPTHMSNITGNMMFLAMAGMNPFSRAALNDGKTYAHAFKKLAAAAQKSGGEIDELMSKDMMAKWFGKNRFITDDFGKQIDLAEMFSDPIMKDLIEAQAFDSVEGFTNLTNMLKQFDAAETTGWSDKAIQTLATSIAGVGDAPGIKKGLHVMSAAYLGEDMIPKMMYASHLARKGWGRDAIVREIGRRLPQYRTVGNLPRDARKMVLPWITFPAEATRIMKNNMQDSPVQMMAWMQAPQVAQGMASAAGVGPDFSEMEDLIEAAPPWAVRYQNVMLDEGSAPEVLGAAGGAAMGGMAGAAIGGAKGAAVGALAGGAGMAALGHAKGRDPRTEMEEFTRSWSMDFLPQSALFLASTHPHEWEKLAPSFMGGTPTPGGEVMQTAKDLTPVEPFAVFTPLLELYSGRGSFGREIKTKSGIEHANKTALGLLGHLMPPLIQKYGMKIEDPSGAVHKMGDIHEANGGQMTLPKGVTSTMTGLALGGLSFLGARAMPGGLGVAKAGAALAGGVGAMAGAEINTRRLMTDLGIMGDPRTGEKGDWTLDFLANSFFGVNKSWRVTPAQAEYNQNLRSKRFSEIRGVSVKELRDALYTGSDSRARVALSEIKKTFVYEHGDTEAADREFMKWSARTTKGLSGLPIFAGISQEKIVARQAALRAANAEKSKMRRQQMAVLRSELQQRQLQKASGLKVVNLK